TFLAGRSLVFNAETQRAQRKTQRKAGLLCASTLSSQLRLPQSFQDLGGHLRLCALCERRLQSRLRFRRKGTVHKRSAILRNVRTNLLPGDLSEQYKQHRGPWLQLARKFLHELIGNPEISHFSGERSGRRAKRRSGGHAQQRLHK